MNKTDAPAETQQSPERRLVAADEAVQSAKLEMANELAEIIDDVAGRALFREWARRNDMGDLVRHLDDLTTAETEHRAASEAFRAWLASGGALT